MHQLRSLTGGGGMETVNSLTGRLGRGGVRVWHRSGVLERVSDVATLGRGRKAPGCDSATRVRPHPAGNGLGYVPSCLKIAAGWYKAWTSALQGNAPQGCGLS